MRLFELTFIPPQVELVFPQALHHHLTNAPVFLQTVRKYQDVVKVHRDDTLYYEVREDLVHHRLEGTRAVREAKVHNQGFEKPAVCTEGRLPLISLLNPYIVVPPAHVQLREILRAAESMDQIIDEGQRVAVLSRDGVERAVVLDEAKFAVLLLDEEDRRAYRRLRRSDAARRERLFEEGV